MPKKAKVFPVMLAFAVIVTYLQKNLQRCYFQQTAALSWALFPTTEGLKNYLRIQQIPVAYGDVITTGSPNKSM